MKLNVQHRPISKLAKPGDRRYVLFPAELAASVLQVDGAPGRYVCVGVREGKLGAWYVGRN